MKNYTQKWKELNKNGIKLSLICVLNWLIKFLFKGQFYLFSAVFLGLLTYYIPQDIRVFTVNVLELIVMVKITTDVVHTLPSKEFKWMKKSLLLGVLSLFFLAGNVYIKQHVLTAFLVNRFFTFWLISLVLATLVIVIQPRLFEHYLFKNVLNKEYLGLRKLTDELPPECNLYTDADENDVDKRMKMINQHAIKKPYQEVVELSFLNKEVTTAISYKAVQFEKENERSFIDLDTIYYPVFRVFPFGIKEDFGFIFIKFKLSQNAAFTKNSEGLLKKDF
ncbi:hypothetical protein [Streptococcus anginosus]|uniref:hypothetical protein n=1 Tax=Streptococcus anginosus TaxID=1328 RepID=UPI0021F84B32|nr:hypothetical protein [Streptococcus anginosus]MCW1017539.1 hypothetical protein [Streptococcus anginosus]